MEFSNEWKSLWPIGSAFSPPLLLAYDQPEPSNRVHEGANVSKEFGPLCFVPSYKSLVELYCSPDLSPRLPPPVFELTLPQFLHTSGGVLPNLASHIACELGHQQARKDLREQNFKSVADFNRLQLLPCCDQNNTMLAFFPSGDNSNQVGYVILRFQDSQMEAKINEVTKKVYLAKEKFCHRILKLSVNPVVDVDVNFSGSSPPYYTVVGYLMFCYSQTVNWYVVKAMCWEPKYIQVQSALLDFVDSKSFRNSTIVHSSWSPHLSEESIVLLANGELYLFELISSLRNSLQVERKKLRVLWNDHDSGGANWLSCEFTWHPRILIVAHSRAIFLVDARSKACEVICLLKIQMVSTVESDRFVSLSQAASNGFNFCVASKTLLLLCDVRQPKMPLLKWVHNLDNPRYLTVFKLSELRPSVQGENYRLASESGSCILLGSFWSCEFALFIYGPDITKRFSTNLFYAWGLPIELWLSGCYCHCGSCLLRDEYGKYTLPYGVDWRQKKDLVMGFSVLPINYVVQLPKEDNSDGFFLLRLMSSGKLELQYYSAEWELPRISSETHLKVSPYSDICHLYDTQSFEHDLPKKFQFLKLEYLKRYLKGNLPEILLEKLKELYVADSDEDERAKNDGLIVSGPFNKLFEGVNLPISIHEISLRNVWSWLQLTRFSPFEFSRVDEFLTLSQDMVNFPFQAPSPFRNRVGYRNIQPSNQLLGSFLPPQFLLTLFELCRKRCGVLSADAEIKLQCDRVLEIAEKLHGSGDPKGDESSDGAEVLQSLSIYKPGIQFSADDTPPINSGTDDGNKRFTNFICRRKQEVQECDVDREMDGLKVIDMGCPVELKFKVNSITMSPEELKLFKLLKKQFLGFSSSLSKLSKGS